MDKNDFSGRLYDILSSHAIGDLFHNVKTTLERYDLDGELVFATKTDSVEENNCYVVSPYAYLISYSKVELHKLDNRFLRIVCSFLIRFFALFLRAFQIDKIQFLNNFMLSTNFFSTFWNDTNIERISKMAVLRHPYHALAIRSVNSSQNRELFRALSDTDWLPLVTRQVYVFDAYDMGKRDIIRDLKLLESKQFIFVDPDVHNREHFEIAETLYRQLYIYKYTHENIQYSAFYMQELYKNGLLHLKLLLDTEKNAFVGLVGIVGDGTVATAPIVGYALDSHSADALYRRCLIYIIKYAHDRHLFLNLSSGAPDFKLNRGARADIEYMFVRISHLSFPRRCMWTLLSRISLYIYKPLLQAYKL